VSIAACRDCGTGNSNSVFVPQLRTRHPALNPHPPTPRPFCTLNHAKAGTRSEHNKAQAAVFERPEIVSEFLAPVTPEMEQVRALRCALVLVGCVAGFGWFRSGGLGWRP